jgi:protein-export membrane protein SecD/preprotein translocase SecF subunit
VRGVNRYVTSILVVVAILAGLGGLVFFQKLKPRLGLDLRGGLSVTLTAPNSTRADVLDKTVEILRKRVDAAGVAEPEISREGSTNVLIQLPGIKDKERLLKLIGQTAQLQFRPVQQEILTGSPDYPTATVTDATDPNTQAIVFDKSDNKVLVGPAELTGGLVKGGTAVLDQQSGGWRVQLRFNSEGNKKWEQFTGRLACQQGAQRQIAIVLDQRIESHPQVATDVVCNQGIRGGNTEITGNFSETEARDLALVLTTGALPVKLEQSTVQTVSPTLGRDSLRAGLLAGALGLALVLIYVLIYYRALGLQTWIGLFVFSAIIYCLVVLFGSWIGWSLTLAGIAGLIVSIGIATDSYIVFFERIKEEVHQGRTLRASVDRGFGHAWRTLRTANFVTILAAIVLYFLAVGSVRGFALALGVATTLDLFIFYTFTYPVSGLLVRSRLLGEGRLIGMRRALEGKPEKEGKPSLIRKIYRSEFNIDFVGRRKIWLGISGVLMLVSVVALVPAAKGLTFGIDFKGGTIFSAPVTSSGVTVASVHEAVSAAGQPGAVVQIVSDPISKSRQVQVQAQTGLAPAERDKIISTIATATGAAVNNVDIEAVGEKWGRQITTKAVRGLVIFLVLVILYMSWRLEPKMAASGLFALFHDVLITAGVYAVVGFKVSPATVVATLTILGYSLYDTVVVFDKIKENIALPGSARRSYVEIANDSMNQVLMRSLNTSLTTLLPVGSLLFVGSILLGADTLKDLALALFVGIAAGTYSSIFVATPLLSIWKENEPRYASLKTKIVGQTREASRPLRAAASDDGEASKTTEKASETTARAKITVGGRASASPSQSQSSTPPPRKPGDAGRTQQKKRSRSKRKKRR